MAAMGQGQAGGEGAAQATQGQGESQGSAGPDLSQLAEQVGGLSTTMEEMRGYLQGLTPQQQEAAQEAVDNGEIDLTWLDQEMTADPNAAAQRLNEVINASIDQRAQALMQPVIERQNEMRINQEARDLAAEFPELADPEVAQKLAGRGGIAEQAAQQLGQPALAAEPGFWRLAYMAHKAGESANSEGSGDPGAAHLESGSGAGPGPTPADLVNQIVNPGTGQLGARVLDGM